MCSRTDFVQTYIKHHLRFNEHFKQVGKVFTLIVVFGNKSFSNNYSFFLQLIAYSKKNKQQHAVTYFIICLKAIHTSRN